MAMVCSSRQFCLLDGSASEQAGCDAMRCAQNGQSFELQAECLRKPCLARGGSFALACNRCKGQKLTLLDGGDERPC